MKVSSGQRYGRLVTTKVVGTTRFGLLWRCQCDCGNAHDVISTVLKKGDTKSCGCLRRDNGLRTIKIANVAPRSGHKMSGTKAYAAWRSMKSRCLNKRHRAFKDYGGRGIGVCSRWMKFENFYADMGNAPTGKSLDRIDNNSGYSPQNCRWTDWKTQHRNTRSARLISFRDETRCLSEWVTILGIPYSRTYERIRRGWSIDRAFGA